MAWFTKISVPVLLVSQGCATGAGVGEAGLLPEQAAIEIRRMAAAYFFIGIPIHRSERMDALPLIQEGRLVRPCLAVPSFAISTVQRSSHASLLLKPEGRHSLFVVVGTEEGAHNTLTTGGFVCWSD